MTLQTAAAYINDATFAHPAQLDRNVLEAIFRTGGALGPNEFKVTAAAGLNATVSAGRAFLLGLENSQQGGYFVWANANFNVPWPGPSGSPRIDTLILRVMDNQYGVIGGSLGASWAIVQGVPAASPVARLDSEFNVGGAYHQPGAWIRVANVRIDPGNTTITPSNITLTLPYAAFAQPRMTTEFTAGGSFTIPSGARWVEVECQAGGGAGGGATGGADGANGGGGGAGGYCRSGYDPGVIGLGPHAITVGSGGTGGTGTGGNGGNSTFAALMTATGGTGGSGSPNAATSTGVPGTGGGATGGNVINVPGGSGTYGRYLSSAFLFSGYGGSSFYGRGAQSNGSTSVNGTAATTSANGYGAGGAGALAAATTRNGGNGSQGIVLVHVHF